MLKLNRRYRLKDWLLLTNGHCGVLRPSADVPPDPAVHEIRGGPGVEAAAASWTAAELEEYALPALLALCDLPPCEECLGSREQECSECGGCGYVEVTCHECPEKHEHACKSCLRGKRPCGCMAPAPLVLTGQSVNRVLVWELLGQAGFDPSAPIRIGPEAIPGAGRGNAAPAILLRQGNILAALMPMIWSEAALAAAPTFPEGSVCQTPSGIPLRDPR